MKKELIEELENYCKETVEKYRGDCTELIFTSFEYGDDVEYVDDTEENEDTYFILTVDGGLNGCGVLLFYLEDVEKLVRKLMLRFNFVWLVDWINDCPDDVFRLRLWLKL